MSNPNEVPDDDSSTRRNWYGADADYPSGMTWDGSMFPPTQRDENVWGPQDPVEFVPSAGPFDQADGEESWRISDGGRDIYTGDVHIRSRAPDAQQQDRQTKFWTEFKTRMAQGDDQASQVQEAVGVEQFPDVLPIPSGPALVLVPSNNTAQQGAASATVPTLGFRRPQQLPSPTPVPRVQPFTEVGSDVDGEYELNDYLPNAPAAPAAQPIPTAIHDEEQLRDNTPPKTSSPRGIDDWDDDNLLSFYKFKVIRKKGYEPMLAHFPGQTIDSLHETWKKYRTRCEQLGTAWKAAGKPKGAVAEWFHE